MLFRVDSNNLSVMIENDETIDSRALIYGSHISGHGLVSFCMNGIYLNTFFLEL